MLNLKNQVFSILLLKKTLKVSSDCLQKKKGKIKLVFFHRKTKKTLLIKNCSKILNTFELAYFLKVYQPAQYLFKISSLATLY